GGAGNTGGGGVFSNGGSTLTVTDSTFLDNQAIGGKGGNGGAGGNGGVGGSGEGGAIRSTQTPAALAGVDIPSTLHGSDSLSEDNEAIGGAGGNGGSGGNGGGGGPGPGGGPRTSPPAWDARASVLAP